MKIYGDKASTLFKTQLQEPGTIYGHNDVLAGDEQTARRITISFFGIRDKSFTHQPKLYIHIFNTTWSSFTGLLREYCLPWRWKTAYLDQENGTPPQRILVHASIYDGELSNRLNAVLGQSLFVTNLINDGYYKEIFGQEFLRIPRANGQREDHKISHPLGKWAGLHIQYNSPDTLCHIHRIRGIFSLLKYHFLKNCSAEWKEGNRSRGIRIPHNFPS